MGGYDFICELERAKLLGRFLPYTVGTERTGVSFDDSYARANLVFFTDSHIDFRNYDESIDNVRRTVDFVNSCPVTIDAVVNAGDAITPFGIREKSDAISRAEKFFGIVRDCKAPFIYSKGNHDLNDWGNHTSEILTDSDWGRLFLDYAEEKYGIVRQKKKSGDKSTWHYYDIETHKIRIIAVDVMDTDKKSADENGIAKYFGGEFYISDEQINWISSEALCFDGKQEKDWGVIMVFHHISGDKPEHQNAVRELMRLCAAFNRCEVYENHYSCESNSFFDTDVIADFTGNLQYEKRPHMICCLVGHVHEDKNEVIDGVNVIWTLNGSATTVASDARIARILGTSTQNCFDVMNIDTKTRKIRMFRYGAGVNCYGKGGDRFLPDGLDY